VGIKKSGFSQVNFTVPRYNNIKVVSERKGHVMLMESCLNKKGLYYKLMLDPMVNFVAIGPETFLGDVVYVGFPFKICIS
jgi:hypothetical protein